MKYIKNAVRKRVGTWLVALCDRMEVQEIVRDCAREVQDQIASDVRTEIDHGEIVDQIVSGIRDDIDGDDIADRVADDLDRDEVAELVARKCDIDIDAVAEKAAEMVFESLDIDEMLVRVSHKIQDSKFFDARVRALLDERLSRMASDSDAGGAK